MLEVLGFPYTGSDVFASALAIDKVRTRHFLQGHGIRMARGAHLRNLSELPRAMKELDEQGVGIPLIVKPSQAGSSVGLTRVLKKDDLEKAVKKALEYSPEALIEEMSAGTGSDCQHNRERSADHSADDRDYIGQGNLRLRGEIHAGNESPSDSAEYRSGEGSRGGRNRVSGIQADGIERMRPGGDHVRQ